MGRVERARERAEEALGGAVIEDRSPSAPRRWFAIGDPQTTPERFFAALDSHALLSDDGTLKPDVGLVSMGDHFDYSPIEGRDLPAIERAGRLVLSWIAAHDRGQTRILFGNHDAARVMELAHETDASFTAARLLGEQMAREDRLKTDEAKAEFALVHRYIPTPGIAARDYASFSSAQQKLVQRLLLEGRYALAFVAQVHNHDVLFTHAAVTQREIDLLAARTGAPATTLVDAKTIARALEERFASAIDQVRAAWERGTPAPLDLSPEHVAGRSGAEGGGLLYHRPVRKEGASSWDFEPTSPRRFDPSELPRDLVQACGHSSHERCLRDLAAWSTDAAKAHPHASLRTLSASPDETRYDEGIHPPRAGAATLYMLDPALAYTPSGEAEMLELDL